MLPRLLLLALILILPSGPAAALGFQWLSAPAPDDQPIDLVVWYPSDAPVTQQPLGLFTQAVAMYGPVAGGQLPLVVISHGTGGSGATHYDIAIALAAAGFIVAAPTHIGDNYKDQSRSFTIANFVSRPRQISRVIDYLLNDWPAHDHIDPARIGMFGHSAGGATALIVLGGAPDVRRVRQFCDEHREEWGCLRARQAAAANPTPEPGQPPDFPHDPRVKAAAVAAPALGYALAGSGLASVTAPVQLWRAENDEITPNPFYADVVKAALPRPPDDHLVPKAGHYAFLAPCNDALADVAPDICRDPPGFDRVAFHLDLGHGLLAFFKKAFGMP